MIWDDAMQEPTAADHGDVLYNIGINSFFIGPWGPIYGSGCPLGLGEKSKVKIKTGPVGIG